MSRPGYELKAELFKALGHPVRIRVLAALAGGPASVADISAAVEIGGSTLSQHLATLRRAGVVTAQREGSQLIYSVVDPRVFDLLEVARGILSTALEGRTAALADLESISYSE